MSLTIEQTLDSIAPQLAADTEKANHITFAVQQTNLTKFGDNYNLAVALRAAHSLTLKDIQNGIGAGTGGKIISKREGDLAVNFAATRFVSDGDPYLNQTAYGMQLLSLINSTIMPVSLAGLGLFNTGGV